MNALPKLPMTAPKTSAVLRTLACAALLAAPAAAQSLAIKAGKVHTPDGELENAVILVENGRIQAIGEDVEVPWDARVIDAQDHVAFPGFVEAHSSRGMDRPNENIDVAPFLSVVDSIDPVNFYFEDALRWGMTTINIQQGPSCVIGAQGLVVKPTGMTLDAMTVKAPAGIKLCASPKRGFSRATQAQALRKAFHELREHLEQLVQEKKDGNDRARREALYQGRDLEGEGSKGKAMEGSAWKVEGLETVPRGEIDEKLEPLLHLVEGRMPAFFYCGAPMDVHRALEIARDNGFLARTTLVLDEDCWKAADMIAEAGVPVVLDGDLVHVERDPITGEETETFVPGVLRDAGVRFALSSQNASTRSLWYQAATAMGLGLTREQAIDATTRVPAEILGLGNRVGALEVGRDANVVLYSGDPLSITSFVEHVVIEGEHVYDRSTDVRMKHLLQGEQPPGTAGVDLDDDTGGDEPAPKDDDDDDGEEEDE